MMHFTQPESSSAMPNLPTWLLGGGGVIASIIGFLGKGGGEKTDLIKKLQDALADGKLDASDLALIFGATGKFDLQKILDMLRQFGGGGVIPGPIPQPTPDDIARIQRVIAEILQLKSISEAAQKAGGITGISGTVTLADGSQQSFNLDTLPKPQPKDAK